MLAVVPAVTLWHCGHWTTLCLQQVKSMLFAGAQPVCSLVRSTVPRAFMATKTAAPIRPLPYQSICLVSRLSFRMRVFSLYAPNSFPIFSSCNILCSQGGQDWTSEATTPYSLLSPAFRTNLLFPIVYHSKTSVNSYRTRWCTSYKAVRFMSVIF